MEYESLSVIHHLFVNTLKKQVMQTINRKTRTIVKHCQRCGGDTPHAHIERTEIYRDTENVSNSIRCTNCKCETK